LYRSDHPRRERPAVEREREREREARRVSACGESVVVVVVVGDER